MNEDAAGRGERQRTEAVEKVAAVLAEPLCAAICDLLGEPRVIVPGEVLALLTRVMHQDDVAAALLASGALASPAEAECDHTYPPTNRDGSCPSCGKHRQPAEVETAVAVDGSLTGDEWRELLNGRRAGDETEWERIVRVAGRIKADAVAQRTAAAKAEAWDECVRQVAGVAPDAIHNPYRDGTN